MTEMTEDQVTAMLHAASLNLAPPVIRAAREFLTGNPKLRVEPVIVMLLIEDLGEDGFVVRGSMPLLTSNLPPVVAGVVLAHHGSEFMAGNDGLEQFRVDLGDQQEAGHA